MEQFMRECGCSHTYANKIREFAIGNPVAKAHFNNVVLHGQDRLRLPIINISEFNEEMIVAAKPYNDNSRLDSVTLSFLIDYNSVHNNINNCKTPGIFRAVLESNIVEAISYLNNGNNGKILTDEELTTIAEKISFHPSTKMTRIMSYGFVLAGCEDYYNYFTSLIDLQKQPNNGYELLLTTAFTDILWGGEMGNTLTCLAPEGSCRLYAPILAGLPNLGAIFVVPKGGEPKNAICRAFMWLDDNDEIFLGQTQPKRYFALEEVIQHTFVEHGIWKSSSLFYSWQIDIEGKTIKRILRMLNSPLKTGSDNAPTFHQLQEPELPCDCCGENVLLTEIHLSEDEATCQHCLERKKE